MNLDRMTYLRPLQSDDVQYLYRWFNDDRVRREFGSPSDPFSISMEGVAMRVKGLMEDGATLPYIVIERNQGEPVGLGVLERIDRRNASAIIQVVPGDEGLSGGKWCKEIVTLLVEMAFSVLNLHRLEARIQDHQQFLSDCLLGCGFRLDGRFREDHFQGGEWRDSLLLSLLRGEREAD